MKESTFEIYGRKFTWKYFQKCLHPGSALAWMSQSHSTGELLVCTKCEAILEVEE